MFAVLALHRFPEAAKQIQESSGEDEADRFGEEVRRLYPFFPAVIAKIRRAFSWRGLDFPAKTRVLLGIYGRNHDGPYWNRPEKFSPDSFRDPIDRRSHSFRKASVTFTRAIAARASNSLGGFCQNAFDGSRKTSNSTFPTRICKWHSIAFLLSRKAEW